MALNREVCLTQFTKAQLAILSQTRFFLFLCYPARLELGDRYTGKKYWRKPLRRASVAWFVEKRMTYQGLHIVHTEFHRPIQVPLD